MSRKTLRRVLLTLVVILCVLSIHWYRDAASAPATLMGMPDWVAVAVLCYVAAAVLNAWAWWITDVSDGDA